MDVQQFVSEFLSSPNGAQATQALAAQGISADAAQGMLANAAEAAHTQVGAQPTGLLGEHAGKSFFAAFAAGLMRGDGFLNSLTSGGEGVITGRIAESLAARGGIDPSMASTVAAAATPFLVNFLKQKFA